MEPKSPSSPRMRWLSAILLLCLGAGLSHFLNRWFDESRTPSARSDQFQTVTGPWGTLQITRITIERPDEFISVNRSPTATNEWFFENATSDQLRGFFRQPDLTLPQQSILLDEARWRLTPTGIFVLPDSKLILSLAPAARQRIYTVLALHELNYYQQNAFSIRAEAANEWFDKSGLAPETEKLIRGLLYQNREALCFADMPEALMCISSPEEKRRLVKAISRKRTLLVKLRVEEGEDVAPLVKYWGKLGQAKDIQPLIESLARKQGGTTLDIVHFLTPFARHRMYTYPLPSEDPLDAGHHCWWSSMNFFNPSPDERFTSFDEVQRTLHADYFPVQGDPTFGDVVWFVDAKGTPVHSAVFIAGDFFFTKNGPSFNEPWFLMSYDDLLAVYASRGPLRVVAYRLKRA